MKRTPVIAAAFLLATTALSSFSPAFAQGTSGRFQERFSDRSEGQDGGSLRDILGERLQERGELRDLVQDRLERRNELRRLLADRLGGGEEGYGESYGEGGEGLRGRIRERLEERQALRDLILDRLQR